MNDVLVLSAEWLPVSRIDWKRAITLLWENKCEPIEFHENRVIRSASQEWKVPSVIRWLKVTTRRRRVVRFSRESIYTRDRGCCQYCGVRVPRNEFTYDHVIPRAKGGQTNWGNVVVSCDSCNSRKGGRTPLEAGMRLLSTPVKPKKLSESLMIKVNWNPSMPDSWRNYLRSELYWHDELDQS